MKSWKGGKVEGGCEERGGCYGDQAGQRDRQQPDKQLFAVGQGQVGAACRESACEARTVSRIQFFFALHVV